MIQTAAVRFRRRRLPGIARRAALCMGLACVLVTTTGCRRREALPGASRPAPTDRSIVQTRTQEGVTLRLAVDHDHVRVGDPFALRITVDAPADVKSVDPPELDAIQDRFDVRGREAHGPAPLGGGRRWEFVWTLSPDAPESEDGSTTIPSLTLRIGRTAATQAAASAPDEREPASQPAFARMATEPVSIVVTQPGPFDPATLAIRPVEIALPRSAATIWAWIVAVALWAGLVAWLIRRARRRRAAVAVERPTPPHDWALRELHRLEREHLPEAGRTQEYYFRLSAIVREYIERRFGLMAPERTTEEFLREMQDHPALQSAHQSLLADFLAACDQVKFARYQPESAECRQAMKTARDFVDATTPSVSPRDAAASPAATDRGVAAAEDARC